MDSPLRSFQPAVYLIVAIAVAAVAYLTVFDPAAYPSPKCFFLSLTGYKCPGCGTQRAVHALMSGHFKEAWAFNQALFVAVPLAIVYAAARGKFRKMLYSPAAIFSVAAAIILWWILRNLI